MPRDVLLQSQLLVIARVYTDISSSYVLFQDQDMPSIDQGAWHHFKACALMEGSLTSLISLSSVTSLINLTSLISLSAYNLPCANSKLLAFG